MIDDKEIFPKKNKAFMHCKLDREKHANVLSEIVSNYRNGFVLAINNKWGTGKTTFIEMWNQDLKEQEYETILFNAWENDFDNNPLVALMGELQALTNKTNEDKFREVLKSGSVLAKNIFPTLISALTKKHLGESWGELAESLSKGAAEIFEEEVIEYANKKNSLTEFKKKLEIFLENPKKEKPLVFIIDELDRCRPDYAVSILEQIKHFFSIPNIVFVLSIDKVQLGHAIRGVYGSELIDSDNYLKRFIDIEYSLPDPDYDKYTDYLCDKYDLNSFFNHSDRLAHRHLIGDNSNFLYYIKFIFNLKKPTLREQEKLFQHLSLVLKSFKIEDFIKPQILSFIINLKFFDPDFYLQLKQRDLNHQQLLDKCQPFLKSNLNNDSYNLLCIIIESIMLYSYNEYLKDEDRLDYDLIKTTKSYFDSTENQDLFQDYLVQQFKQDMGDFKGLNEIINKIDLYESFI